MRVFIEVYMYCIEKLLKLASYRDQLYYWINTRYFSKDSYSEIITMYESFFKKHQLTTTPFAIKNGIEMWYLKTDSKQGLDFLNFVKQYFYFTKEDHEYYYRRTETLIKFLCAKSHTEVDFLIYMYLNSNSAIYNAFSDLRSSATKLFQYFIKRASQDDDFRWLSYALFLYETYFRLNKTEKKIYNENPLDFYKYAEGKLTIL